jgi:hypothetical protein
MNHTDIPHESSSRQPCYHCDDPLDTSDEARWSFQPGLGLAGGWAHGECGTAAEQGRLLDSLQSEFGLSPVDVAPMTGTWGHLAGIAPNGVRLFRAAEEVIALDTCWDSDRLWESIQLARSFRLELTTVLSAPWLGEEQPALLFSTPGSATSRAIRHANPKDRCFACGCCIRVGEEVLDFDPLGLGWAHDACEAEARELAWHELSLRWGLERFDGPWCLHLLGENPYLADSRGHAERCTEPDRKGRLLDHARAWIVSPASPWTALTPAGSLTITSEPYQGEALDASTTVAHGDEPIDVFAYSDLHLHSAATAPEFRTVLHVWVPRDRSRTA